MLDFQTTSTSRQTLQLASVVLTTSCVAESQFVFKNSEPLPTPPPIYRDRNVTKTVVVDGDLKSRYDTAVGVWSIVFVIFLITATAIIYMWHKGKGVLATEGKDL